MILGMHSKFHRQKHLDERKTDYLCDIRFQNVLWSFGNHFLQNSVDLSDYYWIYSVKIKNGYKAELSSKSNSWCLQFQFKQEMVFATSNVYNVIEGSDIEVLLTADILFSSWLCRILIQLSKYSNN